MPTYRSINVSLVSQYDIRDVPEFRPPPGPNDPFSSAPIAIDEAHSTVSAYVPTYHSSQFWIQYSISPPHPPNALFFFKVFINGRNVVSWDCGEDQKFRGKTMFALFDSGERGRKAFLEKRVFCFGEELDEESNALPSLQEPIEIRVFRARGRRRIEPQVATYQKPEAAPKKKDAQKKLYQQGEPNFEMISAGLLHAKQPQRYYQYALFDPLDTPFAVFRFHPRTWAELAELGLASQACPSDSSASSVRSYRSSSSDYDAGLDIAPLQYLQKAEDVTDFSPLSIISEASEPSSSSSSPTSSRDARSSPYTHANQSIEDSPLRIPRGAPTTPNSPVQKARPPTPPNGSPSKGGQHGKHLRQALGKDNQRHLPSSPLSPSTVTSKDRFAQVVRSKYNISPVRSSEENGIKAENKKHVSEGQVSRSSSNASRTGSGLGVSALRKVFEGRAKGK